MTLFWALEILAQDSDLQNQVASEAEAISHDPILAGESLSQLRFTEAVVRETLRLFPQAFMIGRQAIANATIDGSAFHAVPRCWCRFGCYIAIHICGSNQMRSIPLVCWG
jgi:cytochrome P450